MKHILSVASRAKKNALTLAVVAAVLSLRIVHEMASALILFWVALAIAFVLVLVFWLIVEMADGAYLTARRYYRELF